MNFQIASLLLKIHNQNYNLRFFKIAEHLLSEGLKTQFKSNSKEDTMNQNNLLSFALGATITGISAYYVYKNKDEISSKINDLEETLVDDYEALVEKAKAKLEALNQAFHETTQNMLHTDVEDVDKESELKHLMQKLYKLQKEIHLLTKN